MGIVFYAFCATGFSMGNDCLGSEILRGAPVMHRRVHRGEDVGITGAQGRFDQGFNMTLKYGEQMGFKMI